jgi:hypothetical protein
MQEDPIAAAHQDRLPDRHQRLLKSGCWAVTPGTLASGLAQIG